MRYVGCIFVLCGGAALGYFQVAAGLESPRQSLETQQMLWAGAILTTGLLLLTVDYDRREQN